MLKKLLKYELKATARTFLSLYIILFAFAIINRLLSPLSNLGLYVPQILSMIVYVAILVGMFVITFAVMIQRFYNNLLSAEGYLMFTIPVQPWKHIVSKLMVSMMWAAASWLTAIISIFIISSDRNISSDFINEMNNFFGEFFSIFGVSSILYFLEGMLIAITIMASGVLIIYASIAIGHLFSRHRILASVGAFICLITVTQILFVIIGITFGNVFTTNRFFNPVAAFHFVTWFGIIFFGALALGYFMITNYILSNHLNLE